MFKRLFEYLCVHLISTRDQRINTNTDPVDLVVTYGINRALLYPLITLLLLLLSCMLSIQAILHLLDEIPQCVDYCDGCQKTASSSAADHGILH
jgi:hypothetical protein